METKNIEAKNLTIYEKIRNVPTTAQKQIPAGRLKGMTDVNPMWRIKMLTTIFGAAGEGWYTEEIERWKENSDKQTVCFMKINLFYKIGETWSKPVLGIGGAPLISSEKNGIYLSDEAYKMAYTDAISVACKALGMAADIYFNKDIKTRENKTKYDEPETKKESKQAVGSASDDFPEEEFAQGDKKENFEIELASALQEIIAAQNRESLLQIHHNYKNTNVSTDIRYIKALESASKKYPKNA